MNGDLSTEEMASLTSGRDFWNTQDIARLNVPALLLTDGPHGVRNQRPGEGGIDLADSVPSTCFPPAAGLANSFDVDLARRVGEALGVEAAAQNVGVLLGPGINIKRSPLCGRNFEYFSEDPLLSGSLGAAWVQGLQSRGVGASVKHFAANNQETDRMRVSSDVDERTLREIYLRAFQRVVESARPWTVMCSYNAINGIPVSENRWLLTDVLRGEWGFDGVVMSDWGAVGDRRAALVAGLDLEMPTSGGRTDRQLVAAIEAGELDAEILGTAAERMLQLVDRAGNDVAAGITGFDVDAHHALAREAAQRSIVLLKNEGDVLPLDPSQSVAVIGRFAAEPRFQGAGSSLINPTRLDDAVTEIRRIADDVMYAPGYPIAGDESSAQLIDEAVAAARTADVAVVFLGLPSSYESEGFDRTHLDLPPVQLELLDAVRAANPRTVVVLSHGGVVVLPFAEEVTAILDAWLLGQAGGGAVADILFGLAAPTGRLAETVPLRLADAPSFLDFPGEFGHVRYGEGLFVGYRGYDARGTATAFPFGHGLSYTRFTYADADATVTADGDLAVSVSVTNVGARAGREVVQVYVGLPGSRVSRAPRELKAFGGIDLEPGTSGAVSFTVKREDLAYWDTRVSRWVVEPGLYRVDVAASSRDVKRSILIDVPGDIVQLPLTRASSVGELMDHPGAAAVIEEIIASRGEHGRILAGLFDPTTEMGMLNQSLPVGRLTMAGITDDEIDRLVGA